MNKNPRLLIILVIISAFLFLSAVLFVILFFRIFPEKFNLIFPVAIGLGALFGLILYLPAKYFIEKL